MRKQVGSIYKSRIYNEENSVIYLQKSANVLEKSGDVLEKSQPV